MIALTEPIIDITMKINLDLPQSKILEFLSQKGYEIKAYHLVLEAKEEFLVGEPKLSEWTFSATREGEKPSEENLYLKVFERELKVFFKSI